MSVVDSESAGEADGVRLRKNRDGSLVSQVRLIIIIRKLGFAITSFLPGKNNFSILQCDTKYFFYKATINGFFNL